MSDRDTVIVDVTCPYGAALLMRLLSAGESPVTTSDNKMQLHCKSCSRDIKRILPQENVVRVLHIYDMNGNFIHTQIQFRSGKDRIIKDDSSLEKLLSLNRRFTS